MIKPFVVILGIAVAIMSTGSGARAQNAVNATGSWTVTATGESLASGTVKIEQQGSGVAGSYGRGGRIEGKFQPGTLQVDATWSDARGTGWMTILFAADGSRFSGEWGRPGSRP